MGQWQLGLELLKEMNFQQSRADQAGSTGHQRSKVVGRWENPELNGALLGILLNTVIYIYNMGRGREREIIPIFVYGGFSSNWPVLRLTHLKVYQEFETHEKTCGSCVKGWDFDIFQPSSQMFTNHTGVIACYSRNGVFMFNPY